MRYDDIKDKKVLFFEPFSKKTGYKSFPELPEAFEEVMNSLDGKKMKLKNARKIFEKAIEPLERKKDMFMIGESGSNTFFIAWGHQILIHYKFA